MESDQPSPNRKKAKFIPKAPQRKPRPTVPKTEVNDSDNREDESAQAQKLMRKFNENLRRQVNKPEKKSKVQVAFGPGAAPSNSIRTFGVPKGEDLGTSGIKDSLDDEGYAAISSLSIAREEGSINFSSDGGHSLPQKVKKDYREPWDYTHTYYPTTLPLRRPYSGDPGVLNEAEFGKATSTLEYSERTINAAADLGLLEESDKEKMMFFQFPTKLPLAKRSASTKGKEKLEGSSTSQGKSGSKKESSLEDLSGGYMGKMLVYRSGAVKLKLGDTLYDVSPGSDCNFAQDVMAINTAAKHCCSIGELEKRAVVTPDIDSLLNSVAD